LTPPCGTQNVAEHHELAAAKAPSPPLATESRLNQGEFFNFLLSSTATFNSVSICFFLSSCCAVTRFLKLLFPIVFLGLRRFHFDFFQFALLHLGRKRELRRRSPQVVASLPLFELQRAPTRTNPTKIEFWRQLGKIQRKRWERWTGSAAVRKRWIKSAKIEKC